LFSIIITTAFCAIYIKNRQYAQDSRPFLFHFIFYSSGFFPFLGIEYLRFKDLTYKAKKEYRKWQQMQA
jgi:hypothetical protein